MSEDLAPVPAYLDGPLELLPAVTPMVPERPMPGTDDAQDWAAWSRARLDDAGLQAVVPLSCRPLVVATRDLLVHGPTIRGTDEGFALRHAGVTLLVPMCCTDFDTLRSWQKAATEEGEDADAEDEEWQMLWIGHPYPSWRRRGDDIVLSQVQEGRAPLEERWILSRRALRDAVVHAEAELRAWLSRRQ